ncbi:(2Fe-2S) ferredoxin domain-containing protein [Anoxybacillus sp. LAT_35]|uniref:(2Fe-2S) ferredoxin domain-containing protein n=1 Tax=Anoxybacillus TaxID=150247 RepID=UPI001EDC2F4D|nr:MULTISPECIES: (2Fe-2S) ferredoxin domain-containing protein [Anoxybacillus]MCG5025410.1 (2Fe-2S) ferredoxin domain-containing protein [Anoxybacillus flavithermus]MCG6196222.1 (2Fe-2S) ferredoxin domain-containing protein [Anoxybacillus sp. LAT_38]MCG3083763.1 (2Fe-2S) ferredoxin domain-containing protein [Anoxybacillus sp. LAT27]MCG6170435.1 (2Fe-2S) ferredoxin domain-containing protein [Anoxybacillus sp. LAT_11]MCG6175383.1 (2Fe-2S) ferredoxin domain-containing protein [Anoxybacillus sp. L
MATWNLQGTKHHVLICNGGSCMRKGGEEVTQAIRDEIDKLQLHTHVHTTRTRCNGRCEDACVVIVYPEGIWYRTIDEQVGRDIVRKHVKDGEVLLDYVTYTYDGGFVIPEHSVATRGKEK